ncbi:hypothetical protein [Streptomyces sp. NBC_01304]|uniref:hypothetical protein n=1 Tax=Streptomyces sp. NBC_01304 TaxID=2903818 RepID=UPI002E0D9F0D|nr:hypothetical protein OG430_44425 [Streptomyces sp. NBC_01304]
MSNARSVEVDALVRRLTDEDRAAMGLLDLRQLQVEQAGVSEEIARQMLLPRHGVVSCLRMWHVTIGDMEQDWRTNNSYMVYEYLNDLTVRDKLEGYVEALPDPVAAKVRRTLDALDERYMNVTTADGGAELAYYWRALADGRETRWWWLRKPVTLPRGW